MRALLSELEARLADPEAMARAAPGASDDAEGAVAARGGRPVAAAVLVPILLHEGAPSILLTLRSARLSSHAGQVAFPGGRIEPGESAEAAALREAAEEVGLDPRLPRILGRLPDHLTGTGYRVSPVIATIEPPVTLTPDPGEVAEVFEYPLSALLDPSAPARQAAEFRGRMREFWVWPHERHQVWGATAAILLNLARILRD
ncbi:MAG TPA: CoA pyrophosphatase [Acetobacteraceae bacterium]|nr:CoA pyrophosphatase [Acetobacteraceae bacterium]